MKVSFNWLRELVELKPGVTADSVAQQLTLVGLEVESIERRGRDVAGVLVAEVRGTRPHPSAEKLSLVRVVAGGGARRARSSAAPGTSRRPAARSRGRRRARRCPAAASWNARRSAACRRPGMLCSEVELGISEAGDGILILSPDAPAGADLARHVGLLDEVLEVNVTPNRPDALSHVGIAREVAALFGAPLAAAARPTGVSEIAAAAGRGVDVQIRDAAGLPALQRAHHHRPARRPEPAGDARAPGGVRDARDLEPGRRHQLRDAGDRPPAARVRPRQAARRHPDPARGPRRAHDDARRRRSPAAGGRRRDRRRRRRDRAGRRDGRRGQRDLGDHDRRPAGDGDVRSARDPAHGQAAGAAQRGVAPLRARRRRRGHPARQPARRRACWRALGGGAVAGEGDRPLSAAARSRAACRCRSRGSSRLAGFEIPLAQAAEKLAAIGIASAPDGARRV